MIFNKRQLKIIVSALYEAIQTYNGLIDAYTVGLRRKGGTVINYVPKENKKQVAMFERKIIAYKKVLEMIETKPQPPQGE